MGYFKAISIRADEGDREAMLVMADSFRELGNYRQAMYWYGKLKKEKECEEMKSLLEVYNNEEEDIFT